MLYFFCSTQSYREISDIFFPRNVMGCHDCSVSVFFKKFSMRIYSLWKFWYSLVYVCFRTLGRDFLFSRRIQFSKLVSSKVLDFSSFSSMGWVSCALHFRLLFFRFSDLVRIFYYFNLICWEIYLKMTHVLLLLSIVFS